MRHDPRSNTSEAPIQLKSNCGCLLIDDFGRQRVEPAELLNRWIVPLESRIDYLTLSTGKKINVPFEQTIIFSTNLQPESLVDEAFLRRVPFKIEIGDPSREEYMELFRRGCEAMSIQWRPDVVDQLIAKHYHLAKRPLRRCHPRDLLAQVKALSAYHGERPELRMEYLDKACSNYFGSSTVAISQKTDSKTVTTPSRPSIPNSVPVQSKTLNHPSIAAALNQVSQTTPLTPATGPRTVSTVHSTFHPIHVPNQECRRRH